MIVWGGYNGTSYFNDGGSLVPGLAEGDHNFSVRAYDAALNVDPTPAIYGWTIDTTAPTSSLTSTPLNPDNSTDASFEFSCNESSCTFECNLDSSGWQTCTSPVSYGSLLEGSHNFQVRATDAAGNVETTPVSYNWAIDLTPPDTSINSGPNDPTKSTSAQFVFSCGEACISFECNLDSAGWEPCASPVTYDLLLEGQHSFQVRAIDEAGNTDPTPPIDYWTIYLTPPDTQITGQPNALTNSTSASFSFACTDAHTPCTFECAIDSGSFGTCDSPADFSGLAEGSHTFYVEAIDEVGNLNPSPASYTWTIDLTSPETQITAHPASASNSSSASFSFDCTDAHTPCTFQCSMDGAAFASCVSPANYSGFGEAVHTFQVQATDAANNVDLTPASFSWTIDLPPDTTIDSHPSDPSNSRTATFAFSCDQPPCTFECNLDSAGWSACSSPQTFHTPWAATATANAPMERQWHSAIWTGAEMIVWGGQVNATATNTGGRYDPATDSWVATPTANGPASRWRHTAIWTGTEMVVWGGYSGSAYLASGGKYNPTTDSWAAISATNAPAGRAGHTAIFTSTDMIVWGGWNLSSNLNTGGKYNVAGDSWSATSTTNAPSARRYQTAVWTGAEMIVWGGFNSGSDLNTGAGYFPGTNSWIPTQIANAPAARESHTAVWTGNEMIIWGGAYNDGSWHYLNSGSIYNPAMDSWAATSIVNAPTARENHTAVWTGSEMLVWGGWNGSVLNTGGKYNPATDGWNPIATLDAPAAREYQTAIWTGSEMIVWGGYDGSVKLNTGGRFNPAELLSEGVNSFAVRAYDAALNVDPTPATFNWTIDLTPPITSLTSAPANPTNSTDAEFDFDCNEADRTFECDLDSTGWSSCSSPAQYSSLSVGDHVFSVRATDAAGNLEINPLIYPWTIQP